MKNLDTKNSNVAKDEFKQKLADALSAETPEQVSVGISDAVMQVIETYSEKLQSDMIKQHEEATQEHDTMALSARGARMLTTEENKFYQQLSEAMRSSNPQQALTDLNVTFPETTIDRIFEDIKVEHPLLEAVTVQNTSLITKWLLSVGDGVAGWGELCDTIIDEFGAAFHIIEMGLFKLSCFIPVCNAMLDLGPTWLDNYVRQLLSEALAVALELAAVDGDGKTKPIGMTRTLALGAGGIHERKTPVVLTELTPEGLAPILASLAVKKIIKDDGTVISETSRPVSGLIMVVNPTDYFTKVFPATTPRSTSGTFSNEVLPYPMAIIPSVAVPAGKAIIGIGKRYFLGLGRGQNKNGVIEYSDHIKFLEDYRVYRAKLYGNGRPMDENAFVYVDIAGLKPVPLKVEVVNAADIGGGV